MMPVAWVSLDDEQRARVREIYEDAFPAQLSSPFESLLADRMFGFVEEDSDAEIAGLALVRPLGPTGWTFLRYFAAGRHGGGVGTAMFRALGDLLGREGCPLLVWDVEDPDEPGLDEHEVTEHRRRIAFYERAGGVLLPVVEYLPPHGEGPAPSMRLMCRPLIGQAPPTADIVRGTYEHRYGYPADHDVVQRTLLASNLL